jgi:DnaJ family protein C protein 30
MAVFIKNRFIFSRCRMMSTRTDYYAVLGVKRAATQQEIKAAYYAQSKLHHPDVNLHSNNSADQFALLSEAYEILGDVESRRNYDGAAREVRAPPRSRSYRKHGPLDYAQARYNFDEFYRQHYGEALKRDQLNRQRKRQATREASEEGDSLSFWLLCGMMAYLMWHF